ncbi:hypothetical protein Cni_G00661 [Canna indica]|uniref:Uncharacterized protein n=1 Tax=Canna indica TaxID=4628 RepID=A0AAQ3JN69_9LILI|nr:hypothetical protein Cni_G00661 [Canna indica]
MEKKTKMGSPCTRPLRWAKTLFFLLTMLASLLLDCAPPLLVVVLDLLLLPALLSAAAASPLSLQLKSFRFRSSLIDLPIVSAARSLLILCVFLLCDGSRRLYLAITAFCSSASVVYVLAKLFSMSSAAAASPRQALADAAALIEATFLASLAMAIAHVMVAYRISCRERRKLLVYRIDVEAVKIFNGLLLFLIYLLHRSLCILIRLAMRLKSKEY